MEKKLLILFILFIFSIVVNAQDVILKKDGSKIKAKVLEIIDQQIKYKDFDFQDGPTRNINITDVFMITYENGQDEVFNKQAEAKKNLPAQPKFNSNESANTLYSPKNMQSTKDAKGLRNAGIILFSTGMALTFPIGLSLIFTSYEYYEYEYYYEGYYYNYGSYYYYEGRAIAGLCSIIIGPALTASGIVMWAVGQTRMNRSRVNSNGFSLFENEKVQLNLAVGGNSIGLKMNF